MALIDCKKCGKKISSNATECVHCGTILNNEESKGTLEKENILFLLKLAKVLKYVYIILGIMIFIGSLNLGEMGIIGVGFAISLFIMSVIHPAFIINKALILKNLNEINIKVK